MTNKKNEIAQKAKRLAEHAFEMGWHGGIQHIRGNKYADLLKRFVDLYGETPLVGDMIEPGRQLWKEYYEYSGIHMVLTDEGWEPGECKECYEDESDAILDEVNCPV